LEEEFNVDDFAFIGVVVVAVIVFTYIVIKSK
jgi:hypothetical protein